MTHGSDGHDDEIVLTTVGIDVGSSTSHVMFARLRLQRVARRETSRYEVVERSVLWESPISFTPYRGGRDIDDDALGSFLDQQYRAAGLQVDEIDSGAVILTGTALLRQNARRITEALAAGSGNFVCATAGHDLEARLAAFGAGTVDRSRKDGRRYLNVDIGGGTTKFALVVDGEIEDTLAITVGSRLVAYSADRHLHRIEDTLAPTAEQCGLDLHAGQPLTKAAEERLAEAMAQAIVSVVAGREPAGGLDALTVLEAQGWPWRVDGVRFSGGVSEYVYGQADDVPRGDLGRSLGAAVRSATENQGLDVLEPGQKMRATVIGASQFSVQVSGNTICVTHPEILPLRNVAVVRPLLPRRFDGDPAVADAIRAALERGRSGLDDAGVQALAFAWHEPPEYAQLRYLAEAISAGVENHQGPGSPLVIAVDGDIALTLGRILERELGIDYPLVCVDGLRLDDFDYLDIGRPFDRRGVLPVVIKSLVFPDMTRRQRPDPSNRREGQLATS